MHHALHQAFDHPWLSSCLAAHRGLACVVRPTCADSSNWFDQSQEDDDEAITARIPIVLTGLQCNGTEQAITDCPAFGLFRASTICRHTSDVHLVCHSGPNPGATLLAGFSARTACFWLRQLQYVPLTVASVTYFLQTYTRTEDGTAAVSGFGEVRVRGGSPSTHVSAQ